VRAGMLAAEGELIVFTDADGSYGPSELDRVIGALHTAPVAIGVRAAAISGPMMRRVASRILNLTIRYSSRLQWPIAQPAATAVLADPLLPAPPTTAAF
jgi:hypothetical protein